METTSRGARCFMGEAPLLLMAVLCCPRSPSGGNNRTPGCPHHQHGTRGRKGSRFCRVGCTEARESASASSLRSQAREGLRTWVCACEGGCVPACVSTSGGRWWREETKKSVKRKAKREITPSRPSHPQPPPPLPSHGGGGCCWGPGWRRSGCRSRRAGRGTPCGARGTGS